MEKSVSKYTGFFVGLTIYIFWIGLLLILLQADVSSFSWWIIPAMLLQMHLYTGLFITAHDGMHGTISSISPLNYFLGTLCTASYALFSFKKLNTSHHKHHDFVGEDEDPDVHNHGFFKWYFTFMKNYLSIYQIIGMAIVFNVLNLWFPVENLILFWVVPSLLSTLQLFYFGTYVPHKNTPANKHKSTTLKKNHIWAFITCYFFGYHYEHHEYPWVPWWKLYKIKE